MTDGRRGITFVVQQDRKSKLTKIRDMMSSATPEESMATGGSPQLTGAQRIGADLRAARQRLGWSLPDLAEGLRIRERHLLALEEGRIGDLPGPAYALGFLRTYGSAMGLDADELARRYRLAADEVNRKPELTFPVPVPERGMPAGAVVLLGVVLAVGAYIGWYRLSGEGRLPAEVAPPVPARLATLAEQATPPSPPSGTALPGGMIAQSVPVPASSPPASPPSTVSPTAAAAMSAPPQPFPAQQPGTTAPAATAPAPAVAETPAAAPPAATVDPNQSRIVIRAKGNLWIMVKDKDTHATLVMRNLHAGDSWQVPPNKPDLSLSLGNSSAAELVVDGTVAPGFAASPSTRRNLPLDADQIKGGKLPGQLPLNPDLPTGAQPAAATVAPLAPAVSAPAATAPHPARVHHPVAHPVADAPADTSDQ
jgi:cytoskeleton protein RodZ